MKALSSIWSAFFLSFPVIFYQFSHITRRLTKKVLLYHNLSLFILNLLFIYFPLQYKRLRSFLSNQISHPFINQTSFPIKTSFISKKRLFDKKHTMTLFKKETGTENHSAHLFFMTDKTHKDGIAAL